MQSTAFTLSPTLPLHTNPNRFRRSLNLRLSATKSNNNDGVNLNGASSSSSFTRQSWSMSPSSSSFKFRPLPLVPTSDLSPPQATSVPESAGDSSAESSSLLKTLQLGSLFGLWYLFNIYFNIYNKQVLLLHEIYCVTLNVGFELDVFFLFAGFEGVSFPCNRDCSSIRCWNCSCNLYVGSQSLQKT